MRVNARLMKIIFFLGFLFLYFSSFSSVSVLFFSPTSPFWKTVTNFSSENTRHALWEFGNTT